MDIEQRLRSSLAARDPRRSIRRRDHGKAGAQAAMPPRRSTWRVPVALAATVAAAAFGLHWYAVQQREAHAHAQLLMALQITSYELDQVQQKLVRND